MKHAHRVLCQVCLCIFSQLTTHVITAFLGHASPASNKSPSNLFSHPSLLFNSPLLPLFPFFLPLPSPLPLLIFCLPFIQSPPPQQKYQTTSIVCQQGGYWQNMTRNFLISTSSSSSTLHPSGLRAGHPTRPSTALHFAPPPLLRRTQIYFKIFLPDFWPSRSSCGFLRNSGISKQISVPRWSSNLKLRRGRIEKLDQGQSSPTCPFA